MQVNNDKKLLIAVGRSRKAAKWQNKEMLWSELLEKLSTTTRTRETVAEYAGILCKVWASATDAGNQHFRSADVMNTEQVVNFTIRWRNDIKPGMWVLFNGEKWIISTLGEYSFKRTYLGLKASVGKGVSG